MSSQKGNKEEGKIRVSASTLVATLVMIVGLGVIAYPTLANWWNNMHQSQALDDYLHAVDDTDDETIARMLADAEAYNERLFANANRFTLSEAEKSEYRSLLDLNGSGIIGYIEIPAIHIRYPIYHTTSESVLQVAIGHLEGTSLPIGGSDTHAVLSGHRGLPSAVLFSDLDKLQDGDRFTITVLNRTLVYEIDQIRIVEPEDITDLQFVPGKDYLTLITCTPYAVNSHRLLVRGVRVTDGALDPLTPDATRLSGYVVLIGVALPLLVAYLLTSVFIDKRKRRAPNSQDVKKMVTFLHRARQKGDSDEDDQ